MELISVMIADDHPVVRHGLRLLLELQEDIDFVGEAADGAEAVGLAERLLPDVVLMDLVMPELDGIEATRRIRTVSPSTQVIVLTSFAEDEKVFPAIKAGAAGYLLKEAQPQELLDAVRRVHRGEGLMHPSVAAKVMRELAKRPEEEQPLTARELEVLRLLARGLPNKLIAQQLVISEKTVKTHVSNVLAKLHLSDRTQAALYAVRRKLVELE